MNDKDYPIDDLVLNEARAYQVWGFAAAIRNQDLLSEDFVLDLTKISQASTNTITDIVKLDLD